MITNIPNDYTIIDIETTGFSPEKDDIIEIAALHIREGKVKEEFSQLVCTETPLSPSIINLTGITDKMLIGAAKLPDILVEFLNFVGNDFVIGHNISFDTQFISSKCNLYGLKFDNKTFDTLKVCKAEYPGTSHRLEDMVTALGIEDKGAHHRALADCFYTYQLIIALQKKAELKTIIPPQERQKSAFSQATKGLQTLHGILIGITCDNVLTKDEVISLNCWLNENVNLAGNYPYDIICSAIQKVLEDGIIEQNELCYLLDFFKNQIDPLNSEKTENNSVNIEFSGKTICITGDFEYGSRDDVSERLTELGAIVTNSVTRKTDILLVGEKGSEKWACGTYGNKAKKAMEMQEKGYQITILKEKDIQL